MTRGNRHLDPQPVRGAGHRTRRATVTQWILLACLSAAFLASISRVAAELIIRRWESLQDGASAAVAVLSLCLIALLISRYRFSSRTIRGRLLLVLVSLSLLSAIGTTIGSIVVGYITGERQALARLESLAGERELKIRAWCDSLTNDLRAVLGDEYALTRARICLELSGTDEFYPFFSGAMGSRLQWFASQSQYALGFALIDKNGAVALSADREGWSPNRVWVGPSLTGSTFLPVQLPFCDGSLASTLAVAALPVYDADGVLLGAFALAASTDAIYPILVDQSGLGGSGKAYLLDRAGRPLARTPGVELPGPSCSRVESDQRGTFSSESARSRVYTDYRGVPVIGAVRSLPDLGAVLVVEQDIGEALGSVYTTVAVNVGIALILVLVAVLASLFVTQSIARPLVHLSHTAARVSAGDLMSEAVVERDDEVGGVALAFNLMTSQLRELIGRLEERVAQRTRALEERAIQLETSASVSREITSILNIDDLLARVVERIRDTFGYSHVEVFLIGEGDSVLLSRASSDLAGRRAGRLSIGNDNPNGCAAQSGEAILITDWATEGMFSGDRTLPETCSELVVPLRVGGKVLGTLDVHSAKPGAFTGQDALVIQGLGDQIAIAIRNADLYERSRELAVMEERNRLARELHDSVTQSLYSLVFFSAAGRALAIDGRTDQVVRQFDDIGQTAAQALKEMRLQLYELRPLELEREGLIPALRRRLDTVEKRSGMEARLVSGEDAELSPKLQDALYRISLEALNNVLKHSGATEVEVQLRIEEAEATLEVVDNGRGFEPSTIRVGGGMGLATMRERAEEVRGELTVDSHPGHGTRIIARVPRPPAE